MEDIKIEDIINKAIQEKNAKREKREITSWHISGLGGCLRGQYFARLGEEPDYSFDSRTLRVFDMGNKTEEWLVDLLKTQKDIAKTETQVRVEDTKLGISGRVDLILEFRNERIVYEIKSKHSRSFWHMRKKGPQREHCIQLWTYLYLLGIDKGKLVYVSKDDLSIMEFEVNLNDEKLKNEVLMIIDLLNNAWKEKNPLLLPLPEKDSWQTKYCRYHKKCLKVGNNNN